MQLFRRVSSIVNRRCVRTQACREYDLYVCANDKPYILSVKDRVGNRKHFPDTSGAEVIAQNTGGIGVKRGRLSKETAAIGFPDYCFIHKFMLDSITSLYV